MAFAASRREEAERVVIYLLPGTRRRIAFFLSLVLVLLGARLGLSIQGQEKETVARMAPVSHVNTGQPHVGLMVDVSQARPEQVQAALAVVESLRVKGTWFVDATFVESQPTVVTEIVSKGHDLGLKGTDQAPIDRLSQVEIKERVQRSRQALAKAGLEPAPFLYPPLGRFSDAVVTVAFQEGYQAVKPGFDASVMRGKEADAAKKLAGSMKPGDIVVVKVGRKGLEPEQRYLTALVSSLKEHGLAAVPLSALVKGVK